VDPRSPLTLRLRVDPRVGLGPVVQLVHTRSQPAHLQVPQTARSDTPKAFHLSSIPFHAVPPELPDSVWWRSRMGSDSGPCGRAS
jgi:hypothetical protein